MPDRCPSVGIARAAIATLVVVAGLLVAPSAFAAPPSNDDRANATDITVPFADAVDVTEASLEPGEPSPGCFQPGKTVWYRYTPTADQTIQIGTDASDFYDRVAVVYKETPSEPGGLTFLNCGYPGSPTFARLQAGQTYFIQSGSAWSPGGMLRLAIDVVAPPINDDVANALDASQLKYTNEQNALASTVEAGEPTPSCAPFSLGGTHWYRFTAPSAGSYTTSTYGVWNTTVAVYRGGSPGALQETSCRGYGGVQTFAAAAGETLYVQVAVDYGGSQTVGFVLDVAPAPYADFSYYPWDPNSYDTVGFSSYASDPGGNGIVRQVFDFGDGTTADTGCCGGASHRFLADGTYLVRLTVETPDGRSTTVSRSVEVRTHDVAIGLFEVPTAGRPLKTKQITVGVSNRRYQENVTVRLYRSVPGGDFQLVGSSTQLVKVRAGYKTTPFVFSYTFTEQDGAAGKVTFKAEAVIEGARDALPTDNTVIAPVTKVR